MHWSNALKALNFSFCLEHMKEQKACLAGSAPITSNNGLIPTEKSGGTQWPAQNQTNKGGDWLFGKALLLELPWGSHMDYSAFFYCEGQKVRGWVRPSS